MKTIIFLFAILCSVSANSQVFDNILIDGNVSDVMTKFRSKGYRQVSHEKEGYVLSGKFQGEEVELFLIYTPTSRKAAKLVIFFPRRMSWKNLTREYDKYVSIFTEKHGSDYVKVEKFDEPYYLGDGYEISALTLEKCTYSTFWLLEEKAAYAVEITKYLQVKLVLENTANMNLFDIETNKEILNKF